VRKWLVMALLLAVVIGSQYMGWRQRSDVSVTQEQVAGTPVRTYAPAGASRGVVIVAHGFAGNKELMGPWGYYLARQGFTTYVVDQPGHGASARPLPKWQGTEQTPLGDNLRALIDQLVTGGRAEAGRIALVGHSMGGTTVTQAALADARVRATVTLSSAYRQTLPADRPANLFSIAAENDPTFMVQAVKDLAAQAGGGTGELGVYYGDYKAGTARASDVIAGRNHITILYDTHVMRQTALWIGYSFGDKPEPAAVAFGWSWTLVALAGAMLVVVTLGTILAPREGRWTSSGPPARVGLVTAIVTVAVAAFSAVLACVYLRIPWPRVAVLDYLLPYFLVMTVVLLVLRLFWPREFGFPLGNSQGSAVLSFLRGGVLFLGFLGAAGPIIHMNVSNFLPTSVRVAAMVPVAVVFWLYFVQEEGLKRAVASGISGWAGALVGVIGKGVVVLTWFGAAALPNPQSFLPLIAPVMLGVLLGLEFFSYLFARWRYPATATATFAALLLAWVALVTFPLV